MLLAPKKTVQTIIDSGNDYLGALTGNQSGLLDAVETHFQPQQSANRSTKGTVASKNATVSITHRLDRHS
jgi:predicted transposase YbfD/YdcC